MNSRRKQTHRAPRWVPYINALGSAIQKHLVPILVLEMSSASAVALTTSLCRQDVKHESSLQFASNDKA